MGACPKLELNFSQAEYLLFWCLVHDKPRMRDPPTTNWSYLKPLNMTSPVKLETTLIFK